MPRLLLSAVASRRPVVWIVVALSALLASCGGSATIVPTGGGGGSAGQGGVAGSGGLGGSGGSGGVLPPECEVPTAASPPHGVSFQFYNPTDQVLYLRISCWLDYSVTACADGYTEPLSLWPGCTMDCADPQSGCMACEACGEIGVAVEPQSIYEADWPGIVYTFGTNADGCMCHSPHGQPAGLHRIAVPVHLSEEDAQLGEPAWTVSVDFALPSPGGFVEVSLAMEQ